VVVQTDRDVYVSGGVAEIRFTITNRTADAVSIYQSGCGGPLAELQRRHDGAWETVLRPDCPGFFPPLQLAPGASVEGGVAPPPSSGTYRLRVPYGAPGFQVVRDGLSPSFIVR
ncbi:MAG TPA: hypothetical protein VF771_14675, partial [Longimicrobiaceae bacterium]